MKPHTIKPPGSNGVDDPRGRETKRGGDDGVRHGAIPKFPAGSFEFRSCSAVNGAADPANCKE